MMVRIAMLWMIFLASVGAYAQTEGEESWVTHLMTLYDTDDESVAQMQEAYEQLTYLNMHPLDINTASEEDLSAIPGITTQNVNDIMRYRQLYGAMKSITELSQIASVDDNQRRFLYNFLYVKDGSERHQWTHNAALTASVPTYYRAGDIGSGSKKYAGKYLGDPVSHSIRYSMSYDNKVIVNLTGGKSAGEPFFGNGNGWGYDSYAYNVVLQEMKAFKRIIVGTYRARFGMGLTMNNYFSLGKQTMLSSQTKITSSFSPHNSTSDSRHLQGVAATAVFGKWSVSSFVSYRNIDATLVGDDEISTILTGGYHRTRLEMLKKNNSTILTSGAHTDFSVNKAKYDLSIGATFVYSHLNRNLNPVDWNGGYISDAQLYRKYYARGNDFYNASVDYSVRYGMVSLTGETAFDKTGAMATMNTLVYQPLVSWTFTAVQRYYQYQYNSLYGSAFGEGGKVNNESGVMVGVTWKPANKLSVTAYGDIAYFPWFRYHADAGTYSYEGSITASYEMKRWNISTRYNIKSKDSKVNNRLRLIVSYNNKKWGSRTQVEGCFIAKNATGKGSTDNENLSDDDGEDTSTNSDGEWKGNTENSSTGVIGAQSNGLLISHSLSYIPHRKWTLYLHTAYFTTNDYDSRIYAYEKSSMYSFGYSAYSGHGMRLALLVQSKIGRHVNLIAKVGHTRYFDRTSIGSAERAISASSKTDFDIQMRIKLWHGK